MTKKDIAKLVTASYTKNVLDGGKVEKIAKYLSRNDLKQYIRGLKIAEKAKTISLVLPDAKLYNISLAAGTKKRVKIVEDKTLLLGYKIIDNDMIYDMSLKETLEDFAQSL